MSLPALAIAPSVAGAAEVAASLPPPSALAASAPLMFRHDEPVSFPVGGAVLLAVLLLAACAAWWSQRRTSIVGWLTEVARGRPVIAPKSLRVDASVRLDAQTRLHVVHWNDRRLLVAVGGVSGPVVLDRSSTSSDSSGRVS